MGGRGSCSYLCAAHKRCNAADSERKAASCGQLQLPKKAEERREGKAEKKEKNRAGQAKKKNKKKKRSSNKAEL